MRELKVKISLLKKVKTRIFLLGFKSPYLSGKAHPGQFIHIKIDTPMAFNPRHLRRGQKTLLSINSEQTPAFKPGYVEWVDTPQIFLRRPFSIHSVKGGTVYILFKIRGKGTSFLSEYKQGRVLDIIGPLGRGFDFSLKGVRSDVLVGGGIGTAPLLFLAERLKRKDVRVFLGARDKSEIVSAGEFKKLGCKVFISTEDGSQGIKGRVTDSLKSGIENFSPQADIYACGPKAMFKSLAGIIKNKPEMTCQASFEQFMGCGTGICSACVIKTKNGYKKVCKDGPVFNLKEIF